MQKCLAWAPAARPTASAAWRHQFYGGLSTPGPAAQASSIAADSTPWDDPLPGTGFWSKSCNKRDPSAAQSGGVVRATWWTQRHATTGRPAGSRPTTTDATGASGELRQCKCTGHCYTPGHKRYQCTAMLPRAGLRERCDLCRCRFATCERGKHDSHWVCHKHVKEFALWAPPLQCAFKARDLTEARLPVDLLAYHSAWLTIAGDIVWEVLFALIMEPEPISVLLRANIRDGVPGNGQSTSYYANHLMQVCRAMNGKDFPQVWKNLDDPG